MDRYRRPPPQEIVPETANMTPMVDVTFQLIIFFMLVTDISSRQIEALTLPSASRAVAVDEYEIAVNVAPDGRIRIGGRTFSDEALESFFESLAGRRGQGPPLLIRADRSTPFEHVQKVLMIGAGRCGLTRVDMGARTERRDR